MITGVTLNDTTIGVLIAANGGVYQPVSLPLTGGYDRLGKLDAVQEDATTDALCGYFANRVRDGRFTFDRERRKHKPELGYDADDGTVKLDWLLCWAEENCGCLAYSPDQEMAALDGCPIFLAMISHPVWDAITTRAPRRTAAEVRHLFPVVDEVCSGAGSQFAKPISALGAINAFLTDRGLRWAPPAEEDQRYPTGYGGQLGLNAGLEEARHDYRDLPDMLRALDVVESLTD